MSRPEFGSVLTFFFQHIAVLGFAFKADTGDTRESAAITLIKNFHAERALVNVYDPQVERNQIWTDLADAIPNTPLETRTSLSTSLHKYIYSCSRLVKKQVTISASALEACRGAEAVVIATEWKEFRDIDWEVVYKGMNKPAFVFDGRLIIDAEKLRKIGFKVQTIGRGERL
jgi:UDPglucose 6-dehydrogenase